MFMLNLRMSRTWGFRTTKFAGVVEAHELTAGEAVTFMKSFPSLRSTATI